MARTVQQSEQQAAAKSAAKATMEALKSCCIQLGAVQCTHTQAAGHKDSPTHPHTHTPTRSQPVSLECEYPHSFITHSTWENGTPDSHPNHSLESHR